MLASKPSPSGISEGSSHKQPSSRRATSAPRVSRLAKPAGAPNKPADRAPSPLHHAAGIPLDRSSASIDLPRAKPSPAAAAERRSFKSSPAAAASSRTAATDKQQRVAKASELQAQLSLAQEDLRSARERLASAENDRAQALEDLALAQRLAADAGGRLEESEAARRRAEEALELERFESTEREQAAVDAAHRAAAEEWRRKHDGVKRRHAEDVASLIAATRELDAARGELAAAARARDAALGQADEMERIANEHAKEVEALTAQVARLKAHLDAELEAKAREAAETVGKLESEASALRADLQKARAFEEKLAEAEELLENLRVDLAYAKSAEADVSRSAREWRSEAESLEARLEEASRLNRRNEESLASLTGSFEDCTSMLQEKQAQVLQLKEKVASLEKEASEHRVGFLETRRHLEAAAKEASELQAAIDRLRSEHQLLHEAHQKVVVNEKAASDQVGHLTEDKNRLLKELDDTREERDKAKKAVEDLAAALREVTSEAREAKERVLVKQAELENAQFQVSELKAAMKDAENRYRLLLDESNYEAACLRKAVEKMGSEAKSSKDEWISKEAGFVDMLKRSGDGMSSIQTEMNRMVESLRVEEKEVQELKAEKIQLIDKLREFEYQAMNTSSSAEEAKAESSHLRDLVSFKDKELLALNHEVAELRLRNQTASEKITELSKLIAEVTARRAEEETTEKSKALTTKLEMDKVLESLKSAECEAKAAKDEKAQLQSKVRQLESKITEANLTSEEAKISSLRLKETLEDKEHELASIARENSEMRAREATAQARIDELAALLAEATARKGGEPLTLNGTVARSPEKQPSALLKLICSPMHHSVRDDDENSGESVIQVEDIKHVEVETVRQVKREKEIVSVSVVDDNCLENSKIIEDDLSKERDDDSESIDDDDDDDDESPGDDGVEQMNGLLIHGPTSSFNQDQHVQKKKKALLRKFGSLLKKKAHFTKLSSHS